MSSMRLKLRITRVVEPAELNRQIKPKFTNLMHAMGRRAQRIVPKRTWALHDTITTDVAERGTELVGTLTAGGGRVGYAIMVERGTSRMAAQPYLLPAMLQSKNSDLGTPGGLDPDHGTQLANKAAKRAEYNSIRRARRVGSAKRGDAGTAKGAGF